MNKFFKNICFTDDVFRSSVNGLEYNSRNRLLISSLFGPLAKRAGYEVYQQAAKIGTSGEVDVLKHMNELDIPCSPDGWARICDADLMTSTYRPLGEKNYGETLIFGWGLSPAQMRLFDRMGMSFIDIEVSPLKIF